MYPLLGKACVLEDRTIFFFFVGASGSTTCKFKDTVHKDVFWLLSSESANLVSVVLSFIGATMD